MKTTLFGRSLFLSVASLAIAFTFNSCRKDLLVKSPDNLKNALSITEARSYFNSHFPALKKGNTSLSALQTQPNLQTLFANKQPIWNKAYKKMISTGGAVKIPLDFGESYAVVNQRTKAIVPVASLNYLLMYKDKKDSIHAEWVRLAPDSSWLYGKRDIYRGRIFVYDWNGRQLKSYRYGNTLDKTVKNVAVQNVSNIIEIEDCYRFSNGRCPKVGDCAYECDMCLATCAYEICIVTTDPICESCTPTDPPINPPGGTGGGQDDNGGPDGNGPGSGNPGAGDYPPNCNPNPNYVVPSYPAPEGMEWIMPCGGDVPAPEIPGSESVISYEGLDISAGVLAIAVRLELSHQEALFLESKQDISTEIGIYLGQHLNSADANAFAKWMVGYLVDFPDTDMNTLIANNNIPNSNINLPILDTSELTSYPAFKALVEDLPNFLNNYPNILKALEYTTGFKPQKIKQLMQPGKGPKVVVVHDLRDSEGYKVDGHYNRTNKVLQIDDVHVIAISSVNNPAQYQALGLMLTIVTLHEFVHFGRHANDLPIRIKDISGNKLEAGWYFEGNIQPLGAPGYMQPSNAKEWLKFYKVKPKN